MHCVSAYPCEEDRINLQRIKWLKGYNQRVGLSDHTQSTIVPALALSYEIEAIEKHFTIDNDLPGRDNKFALNPIQFKEMVQNMNIAQRTMIDHGNNYQDIESDTMENYRGRWESHDYE